MTRRSLRSLALCLLLALLAGGAAGARATFLVAPYLQLGLSPKAGSLVLTWIAPDRDADWSVRVSGGSVDPVVGVQRIFINRVPYRQCAVGLNGMSGVVGFRVMQGRKVVSRGRIVAPPPRGGPYHAALMGDFGDGSGAERLVAAAVYRQQPGLVLIAGDIAYPQGTHSDYITHVFPVYNYAHPFPGMGVPLMRSVPFVAAPGNHDVVPFTSAPDALAYFYDWLQPLNGPSVDGPRLDGPPVLQQQFRQAVGSRFPRMGSFSFDWGCSHWLVLDSNPYIDWRDPLLRRWVAADLEAAQGAAWRFVLTHHAPFHSSAAHENDQWMRVLADVFEQGHVSVVFAGHVHNYERSVPLRFVRKRDAATSEGRVDGQFILDRRFDGVNATMPQGVVYVVSGAGGAPLYDADRQSQRQYWQPFTTRFVADTWSFTDLQVTPRSLTVRQLGFYDNEVDRFTITQ